jgi:hypothetical protein
VEMTRFELVSLIETAIPACHTFSTDVLERSQTQCCTVV